METKWRLNKQFFSKNIVKSTHFNVEKSLYFDKN